jgi:hypothetical protein
LDRGRFLAGVIGRLRFNIPVAIAMNPLGVFQAVIIAVETALQGLTTRRKNETRKAKWQFLFFYWSFVLLASALLIWVVRWLYFDKLSAP